MRITVDARPLDLPGLRTGGIGRYAHGLLGPLADVAAERGHELVALRARAPRADAFGGGRNAAIATRTLRRPPLPERVVDPAESLLLPIELRRARSGLHHSLSIYRAALAPGVPSVTTVHDVIPLMWPDRYLRSGLGHRLLYRAACRADLVIVPSEAVAGDVGRHLGIPATRIAVVPEGVDRRFEPTDPAALRSRLGLEGPYLVSVGGLGARDPRKALDALVEAFARWTAATDRAETLVLCGALGASGRALQERARALGARVAFPGFVDDGDLPALLSGATCLITASRYEGFGLTALEAVACGTPVVAHDIGAIPEASGPGGIYVPDGDVDALLAAAGKIADGPELRERLAGEGRAHAAALTWRRAAEGTFAAYERAMAAARASA